VPAIKLDKENIGEHCTPLQLSSGRMLTAVGILLCSTSHTGSRDYNIGECESRLPGFYFILVVLPAAGIITNKMGQA